jgi:hypothetical protein
MLQIAAGHLHHFRLVPVVFQQRFAVTEETRVRQAVILQHDQFFRALKRPVDARGQPLAAAHVFVRVVFLNLAGPVDALDERARRLAALPLTGPAMARRVGDQQQPLRPGGSDARKYLRGSIGATEKNQRDGCAKAHAGPT